MICIWALGLHKCLHKCLCLVPVGDRRGHQISEMGIRDGCEAPCEFWELNSALCKTKQCSLSNFLLNFFFNVSPNLSSSGVVS